MGIRYEKDTILNWISEMGKFLRLLVDKWDGPLEEENIVEVEEAYKNFFKEDRLYFLSADQDVLEQFVASLDEQQVRPLALLLMYDGLIHHDKALLQNAKFLLEHQMKLTGAYSFADFENLSKIDNALK